MVILKNNNTLLYYNSYTKPIKFKTPEFLINLNSDIPPSLKQSLNTDAHLLTTVDVFVLFLHSVFPTDEMILKFP